MPTKATSPATAGADISSPCSQSRFLGRFSGPDRVDRTAFTVLMGGLCSRPGAAAGAGSKGSTGSTVFTGGSCSRRGGQRLRVPAAADTVLRDLVSGVVGEVLVDGAGRLGQRALRVGAAVDRVQGVAELGGDRRVSGRDRAGDGDAGLGDVAVAAGLGELVGEELERAAPLVEGAGGERGPRRGRSAVGRRHGGDVGVVHEVVEEGAGRLGVLGAGAYAPGPRTLARLGAVAEVGQGENDEVAAEGLAVGGVHPV